MQRFLAARLVDEIGTYQHSLPLLKARAPCGVPIDRLARLGVADRAREAKMLDKLPQPLGRARAARVEPFQRDAGLTRCCFHPSVLLCLMARCIVERRGPHSPPPAMP